LERRDITAAADAAQSKSVAKKQDARGSPDDLRRRKASKARPGTSSQPHPSTNDDAYTRSGARNCGLRTMAVKDQK